MLCKPAESCFLKGMKELKKGNHMDALVHFEAALDLEKKYGKAVPQSRYLSYYGLCVGIVTKDVKEAINLCKKAVELEFYNPDLFHNLGYVYLLAGMRLEARNAFIEGLKMQNNHREILQDLKRLGVRRKPIFPFLHRSHILNKIAGKLASSIR
ncbi:MAG: hypothetical protein AB1756_01135 [Acidobacteriota bacterium]